jgi:hypothetical protein
VAGVSYPVKHKNRFILNFNNSGYGWVNTIFYLLS